MDARVAFQYGKTFVFDSAFSICVVPPIIVPPRIQTYTPVRGRARQPFISSGAAMSTPAVRNDDHILWLTENDVIGAVSLNDAIPALAAGLIAESKGEAANLEKSLGMWNGQNAMHALGSMMPFKGYVGFKTWAHTIKGAAAVFSLFDADNGRLLALMEAVGLGQMRTAGISGLATQAMADPDADEMAVIGTGSQSLMQVAAVAATRKLRRLRVYSPTPDKRSAFVAKARAAFQFEIVNCASLADAVKNAGILTLITRARAPFLDASMIARGTHINAAGAILPGNSEFHPSLFERATLIAVDSVANARKASTEFREHFGTDDENWSKVRTLGALLAQHPQRAADTDLTLFKPMGMGLSDLCVAALVYEQVLARGTGVALDRGQRQPPRWTAAETLPPGRRHEQS
jgi:alanine dehydrogenase